MIILTLAPSFALGEVKRMSDEIILEVVKKIAPNKQVLHKIDSINPPTMVFVWHGSSGVAQDVLSEKDPFTGEAEYFHSWVVCKYQITFFTPLLDTDVHVDADIYVLVRNSLGYKSLNTGTGFLIESQKILRSDLSGADANVDFAGNMAGHNRQNKNYSSNSAATAAIEEECSLKNLEVFEIQEGRLGKGYLIRGEKDRLPEFGNTTFYRPD